MARTIHISLAPWDLTTMVAIPRRMFIPLTEQMNHPEIISIRLNPIKSHIIMKIHHFNRMMRLHLLLWMT